MFFSGTCWPSPTRSGSNSRFHLNTIAYGRKMKSMRFWTLTFGLLNALYLDFALLYLIVKALSTRW